jgi:hypothetical protein
VRLEMQHRSKKEFRRLQGVSGLFGMVAVAKETEQGQEAIHRFETGTQLRVCTSDASLADAEDGMLADGCWQSRAGTHGSVGLRFSRNIESDVRVARGYTQRRARVRGPLPNTVLALHLSSLPPKHTSACPCDTPHSREGTSVVSPLHGSALSAVVAPRW